MAHKSEQSSLPPKDDANEPPPLFDRLRFALLEDLGPEGDVTSQALVPEARDAEADFVAKAPGVICGVNLLGLIFTMAEQLVSHQAAGRAWQLDDAQEAAQRGQANWNDVLKLQQKQQREEVSVTVRKKDGERVAPGDVIASVKGNARALLAGERVSLNLLTHFSGVATQTAAFVESVKNTRAKIIDTRKTTPLWRDLEKYAVKCGGGENHRRGLWDMILIKDNHLALWGERDPAGAVNAARKKFPDLPIEVEVTDLAGLKNVCEHSTPEMILLDNFEHADLVAAVHLCDEMFREKKISRRPLLEASGGVKMENIRVTAESGVDRISIGALTHSVKALDISLEMRL